MKRKKTLAVILTIAVLVGQLVYLLVWGINDSVVYYKTVDELLADPLLRHSAFLGAVELGALGGEARPSQADELLPHSGGDRLGAAREGAFFDEAIELGEQARVDRYGDLGYRHLSSLAIP